MAIQERKIATWEDEGDLVEVLIFYNDVTLDITQLKVVNPSGRQARASIKTGTTLDSLSAAKRGPPGDLVLPLVAGRHKMVEDPVVAGKINLASDMAIQSGPVGRV